MKYTKLLLFLMLMSFALSVHAQIESNEYKKPPMEELQQKLTPLQFKVTQEGGTETPYKNEYWDNKKPGIYVDVVTGEPLFASTDKFESHTGWPSFTKPLQSKSITEHEDTKLFAQKRVEVRSKNGDSHLGHLFKDERTPTGDRYCVNSASLRFVPVEELDSQGYGEYNKLFEDQEKSKAE